MAEIKGWRCPWLYFEDNKFKCKKRLELETLPDSRPTPKIDQTGCFNGRGNGQDCGSGEALDALRGSENGG